MLFKYFNFLFLVFASVLAEEKDVVELTDETFSHELERLENTLVMFYAPWCGHCKRLKPEYAKAAEMLLDNDPSITLAKVDCTESGKDTCNKYSVSGYPTLKIFSKGDFVSDYNGPREAVGIAKYMKAQVGPASKELNEENCLKSFLDSDEVSVVGFFEKEDLSLATTFHAVSKKLKEKVRFAHTTAKSLMEKEGYKNTIVLYRPKILQNKFEANIVKYDETMGDIQEFINKNYFGIAGVRTRDNTAEFKNPLVVAYYAVDYIKNSKGTNYWRNRIIKVAKDFPNLNFAISSKDDFQHELNDFGIDFVKGDKPVILARNINNQKFVMKDEFSVSTFEAFLKDMEAGVLEPYLKSEPIPEDNSGNVKIAVARNFDELVTNNDKDTLIEFYAPWCGHCKKLAPVYDELGEKLANEDVEIIKFDATANDVPGPYEVRGFPTLYWAPKNSKNNPVKYEGGRELDDFIKYIAKHATNELKGFDRKGKSVKPKSDEL
ncbi:protein disulfide-isomerase A3 [Apis mellifera caucasica]|uniref:Protein disulfide-isomerase n=1 Tax=Apis mellifera TaxID=7460 RepID=A0A7M7TFL1_APIME|nr:protein disulfide-isomerase A3 [Apis mellifera]KAG6797316.1 protein disulfide-isomerase A3 [Apis mellifera caucasica]|eukprot:XP_623282.2 protein disulfide-isomerase A3 [Apis mellifera]